MAIKTIEYNVNIAGITPATEQFGGTQGDHKVTMVEFVTDDLLNDKITDYANEINGKAMYRFDVYDGEGGIWSSEPKELEDYTLSMELEERHTRYGGKVTIYLVFTVLSPDCETEIELYSFPAVLRLKNRPEGTYHDSENYESVTSLVESAKSNALAAEKSNKELQAFASQIEEKLKNGEFDGVSVTHSFDGTVLKMTSASGTTEVDLKGEKGDDGKDAVTDLTYKPKSENAQSGKAVAEAVNNCIPKYFSADQGAPFSSVLAIDNDDYDINNPGGVPNDSAYKYIRVHDVDYNGKHIESASNYARMIPTRDDNGNLWTGVPIDDADCVPKEYVDTGFVKKVESNYMTDQVYAVNSLGQQQTIEVEDNRMYESGSYNFPHRIPRRNGNGNLYTGDPIEDLDCANKQYVDAVSVEIKKELTLSIEGNDDLPTPILKLGDGSEPITLTWDGTVATSFSSTAAGTKDDPIIISTASELNYLVNKATNTTGKYYKIADGIGAIVLQSSDKSKDITSLSNETAVKIYFESNNCTTWRGNTSPNTFDGHFDGNGATIYGLYIKETSYSGLFGTLGGNSTVKNLTVKNSYFKTGWYAGVIAGNIADSGGGTVSIEKCVITNCCVVGKYIVETDTGVKNIPNQCIGLMFGRPNNVDNTTISISNCLVCGNNVHYEYDGSINNYLIGLSKDTKIKNSVMLNFADLVFNGISAETLNIYTDQEITNIEDIKGEKAIAAMPNLAWGVDWFAATTYNAKPVPLDFLQLGTTALLAMINDNQDALNGKKITSLHTSGKYTFDWNAMYFIKSNSGNDDITLYNSVTNAVLVDGDGNNLPAASLCILIMPEESTGVAENSKLCFFVGQTGTFSILNPNVFKGLQFTVNNGDVYFTPTTSASVFKIAL